jgi:hypothetical protein
MNNHFHQLVDFLREAGALADGSPPHLSANDG